MHSSLISKIRILKPRKKTPQTPKTITIKNLNFNTSLNSQNRPIQSTEESPPPPLIHKSILDDESIKKTTNDESQKWLPVYIVNVPKSGVANVSTIDSDNVSKNKESGSGSTSNAICSNDKLPTFGDVVNKKNASRHTFVFSNSENSKIPLMSGGIGTVPFKGKKQGCNEGAIRESSDKPCIQNENEPVKSTKPISCFLCPLSFETVLEMQSHYLDSHKQKKRMTATTDSGNRSSSVPSKYKPIKSKDIFDPGEGEPKCPICSIDFKTEEEVKEHMTSVHCYKCSECQNTFYTLFQFTDHRCNQGNKLKKTRLKKRKVKVKLSESRDEDPLSLSPRLSTVTNQARSIFTISNNTANYNLSSRLSSFPTKSQANLQQSSILNTPLAKPNLSADSASNLINYAHNNKSSTNSSLQIGSSIFSNKSLFDYSLEELTSKEFNRMKLSEIMQNPNLSIKVMKKTKSAENVKGELFSCGRCNVLCEDKNDFTDHLEECLRLSNVSLISSHGPPKRNIKLKSELVRKKICNYTKTSINQKLLTQLKNYIDSSNIDLFQSSENISNGFGMSQEYQVKKRPDELFHPDIKGNISIRKIDKCGAKTSLSKNACSGIVKCKQPMVVIPIDKSFEANNTKTMPSIDVEDSTYITKHKYSVIDAEDHYPEISIIDKSNCVTYKFTGSGTDPELKYDPNLETSECTSFLKKEDDSNVVKLTNMPRPIEKASHGMVLSRYHDNDTQAAREIKDMLVKHSLLLKTEPSTSLQPHIKVICNPDSDEYEPIEEKYSSSLELILDEEEIKMEVEDEIVDDCF